MQRAFLSGSKMSVYRGVRVSRHEVVVLRPDGTYCVHYLAEPLPPPTPPTPAEPDAVARRLLREAGVIDD